MTRQVIAAHCFASGGGDIIRACRKHHRGYRGGNCNCVCQYPCFHYAYSLYGKGKILSIRAAAGAILPGSGSLTRIYFSFTARTWRPDELLSIDVALSPT